MQQQNFIEIIQKMQNIPGWEILQNEELIALKVPTTLPLVNFVWAEPTIYNIKEVAKFYNGVPYSWLSPKIIDIVNFEAPQTSPEMHLDLNLIKSINIVSNIKVIIAKTANELQIWAKNIAKFFD